ncbi:P-loop containing nucleoside triphosphate hydrolase protein [Suillus lakei]|nr:P-loop containing nucleoside triphosphate hydrolase protein [Suillus lakei]
MGKRKILVYTEFPMMEPLITSVLKLHNISALPLNGTHTVEERNETIHKFTTDPEERVLLLSNVGAVGLNLTVANVIILFDQCWSRMLVNQIIGRAWRLGQEETVLVYNMVAVGTVDVLMVDHGEGKGRMLGQFLSTKKCTCTAVFDIATSTDYRLELKLCSRKSTVLREENA